MSDALTEYTEKADQIRGLIPWATDDLVGVILAICATPTASSNAAWYDTATHASDI